MTRKQIVELMDNIFSKGLNAALVVYRSPITDTLEERHIYADDYREVLMWAEEKNELYLNDYKLDFAIWINNSIRFSHGELVRESDCYDE